MEDKKRTIMAVLIIAVVLLAVMYSFLLNLFAPAHQIELADPDAAQSLDPMGQESGQSTGVVVDVTPQTVQSLIASLERYESYRREALVQYLTPGGQLLGEAAVQVWVDGGWTRTKTTLSSGVEENAVVGEGTLWLWYDNGPALYSGPADRRDADLSQRLPTYEDVLALDKSDILAARYEEKDGQPCVYVEAAGMLEDTVERFWVSVNSGLLVASETLEGGGLVYSMSARNVVSPLDQLGGIFVLPDGTVLHPSQER